MKNKKTLNPTQNYSCIKFLPQNRSAAMEMSVGTIVTIVLLMSVLVLGIFLVQNIFSSAKGAIDSIDNEVESNIQKIFSDEGKRLAIYPTSRKITLKKGDEPKGFAFSVLNKDVEAAEFTYTIIADSVSECGSLSKEEAESFLVGGNSGGFSLDKGNSLELPRLVIFNIPETAPPCTIRYYLDIQKKDTSYAGGEIYITIK